MKFFIVLAVCVAASWAKPALVAAPAVVAAAPAIAGPISTQYHAQDELGQYSYGYANPLSAKSEAKAVDGSTVGGYSYVDGAGLLQSVQYAADDVNGFRVSATNLPVGPAAGVADTAEVVVAKAQHFAAVQDAQVRAAAVPAAPVAVAAPAPAAYYAPPVAAAYAAPYAQYYAAPAAVAGPVVPADTPEVAQAKAQHFAAVAEAQARNAYA